MQKLEHRRGKRLKARLCAEGGSISKWRQAWGEQNKSWAAIGQVGKLSLFANAPSPMAFYSHGGPGGGTIGAPLLHQ